MSTVPREISQRAAQAARVFIPAVVALALSGCAGEAPPLPRLVVDPDRVAVVGMSSGAYMATQTHFAWSDRLRGAALVAGGPYGCAGGSLDVALGLCMTGQPDASRLAGKVRERAADGAIAPVSGLAGDRVFVLHGKRDATVSASVSGASADVYAALADEAGGIALRRDGEREFGHVLPVAGDGVDCIAGGSPYLGACGFDAAGEVMAWLFGEAPSPAAAEAAGPLISFNQDGLLANGEDAQLADRGHLYLPPACQAGEPCGVLVVFHGCQQNADAIGDVFARSAGFNRWADVHRVAVLYPQTRSSYLPLNPKACWDWWGYSGPDYDTRRGVQQRWLAAAMAALGAPLEGAPAALK
jgi:poly(3-hydroxybutyrate) depolymerase